MPCRRRCVLTRDARADDVLKARLKTTGVVEHTFTLSNRSEMRGVDWKIYDVGGARNQRHAWAPYFDDGELFGGACVRVRVCAGLIGVVSQCDYFPGAD